jgi:uncharacterized membrane protein YfcA
VPLLEPFGGLIGLGGAEFRLPLLISLFRFRGLEAVILNKAVSLVVVATALPFRAATVSFAEIGAQWPIVVNLLAGSLVGAYTGAEWATLLKSETLYKVISALLIVIAGVLLFAHGTDTAASMPFTGWVQIAAGILAGYFIGVVASLLGVAGGEFLIPTLVLLFGAHIKLAGSLSLAVSLPTLLVGLTRYAAIRVLRCWGKIGGFCWSWRPGRYSARSSVAVSLAWCPPMSCCPYWRRCCRSRQ